MFAAKPKRRRGKLTVHALALGCLLATLGLAFSASAQEPPREIRAAIAQKLLSQAEALATAGKQAEALNRIQEVTGPAHQFLISNRPLERRLRLLLATLLARTQGKQGALQALKLLSSDLDRITVDRALRVRMAEVLSYLGDGSAKAAALRLVKPTAGHRVIGKLRDPAELMTLARLRQQDGNLSGVEEALSVCRTRASAASTCSKERLLIDGANLSAEQREDLSAVLRRLQAVWETRPGQMNAPSGRKGPVCSLICERSDDPLCD